MDVTQLRLDGESLLPYVLKDNSKRSNGSSRTFFHHCNSEIFAVRLVMSMKYYLRILTCFICNIYFSKIFVADLGYPFSS